MADKGSTRKFYKRKRRFTLGYKIDAYLCRNQGINLVIDVQSMLGVWQEHFARLLNRNDDGRSITRLLRDLNSNYPLEEQQSGRTRCLTDRVRTKKCPTFEA